MKDGWEIKKLGEVADILNGFAFKSDLFKKEGDAILRISNIQKGLVDLTDVVYFSKSDYPKVNIEKYAVLPEDIVVALSGATTGKFGINRTNKTLYLNQRVAICREKTPTLKRLYLLYYLKTLSTSFLESAEGVAQPNLSTEKIKQYSIPIPPLPEQERIVSELDCINGILEKKREQIKELDALAQSIFYHMFGDPVTNEKGWEVKKLGEVCKTTSGGTPSKNHNEYYDGGTIPWLRSGEVDKMFIYDTELFITEDGLNNSSAKWFPENTVVIAMYGATVGQVGILKNPMTTNQAICGIFPNETFLPIYLYHFLLGKKQAYIEMASGGAQPNISQNIVRDTLVGCPPLSLQQSFATKIAAIEKQKELIKRSIAEVETLLASRMQHHFNS